MKDKQICYECAYWLSLVDSPPSNLEVVKGMCVQIFPEADKRDKTLILGGKGKMRYFVRPDRSVIKSNDIWKIGKVPKFFLPSFPDTLIEITQKAYKKLNRTNIKCQARGCYDRYHCFRYNLELESNGKKPFNIVPSNWKIGEEHCRYFINMTEILK